MILCTLGGTIVAVSGSIPLHGRASITLHWVAELIVFNISLLQGTFLIPFLGIDQLSSSLASQNFVIADHSNTVV
jgi:hypothetical protein